MPMILVSGPSDPVRLHLQKKFRSSGTLNRALFLDRDGVLNRDYGYVGKKEDFNFIESSLRLVRWGTLHGYLVIIVTNQSGLGRGFFSLQQFEALMRWVDSEVRASGGDICGCYFSPVDPTNVADVRPQVFERKPSPEMVCAAIEDFNIDVSACFLVGDNISDLEAGRRAGIQNVLLFDETAGASTANEVESSDSLAHYEPEPLDLISRMHTCDGSCRDFLA